MLDFITMDEYFGTAQQIAGGHWSKNSLQDRWEYHQKAIEILHSLNLMYPSRVLELGTMGVSLVHGSHTMDYAEKWNYPGEPPNYLHDARRTPWPMPSKSYDLFIALRVFQHLTPVQRVCFLEAKRIAKNVLIVCPSSYKTKLNPLSRGIAPEQFLLWNGGLPPVKTVETKLGWLHFWNEAMLPPEKKNFTRLKYKMIHNVFLLHTHIKNRAKQSIKYGLSFFGVNVGKQ